MSDLFISYSRENRDQIKPLVSALERQGWTVWWDRNIPVGKTYDEVIQQALDAATCVIVVWTKQSIISRWVRDEASRAAARDKLFPVKLEEVNQPLGLGLTETANLQNWDGRDAHPEFTRLVQAIRGKCPGPEPIVDPPIPLTPHPFPKVWHFLFLIGLPILVGVLLWLIPLDRIAVQLKVNVSEFSLTATTQQELSDPLAIVNFKAAGLRQIQIPATSESPHESLTIGEEVLGTIALTLGNKGEDSGVMTLDTITLPSGSAVRIAKSSRPFLYDITFDQLNQALRINVKGPVEFKVPGIGEKHRDFRFPKPILLQPGPSGLDVEITVVEPPDNLLPGPLSVTNLGFDRIEERRSDDQTTIRKVSTILNGNFLINGEPQQLTSEEYLQIEHSEGSLRTIRLNQESLDVEFHGQVQGMGRCQASQCTSLMPTYGKWLVTNYSIPFTIGVVIYVLIIFAGLKKLRSQQ